MPPSSSHEELLLKHYNVENWQAYQKKHQFKSEYIALEQKESTIGIAEIRKLAEQLSFGAAADKHRLVVLYHADQMSIPAQNACLKLLEEPPANTELLLTVTHADALLDTIRSRCSIQNISKDIENTQNVLRNTVEEILSEFNKLSLRELTELAEKYKESTQAHALLSTFVIVLSSKLEKSPSTELRTATTAAVQAEWTVRETNTNPRMVIESFLFELKQLLGRS